MINNYLLDVRNLSISSITKSEYILKNISFNLDSGYVYSILGKNGAGKSILLKSLTALVNRSIFKINGEVIFQGQSLFEVSKEQLVHIRKKFIRYVFQDALNSFDPLKKFQYYFKNFSNSTEEQTTKMFSELLLQPVDKFMVSHPYEVSIGQVQRLSFALGLLSKPTLLILDEPTSSLDHINTNLFLRLLKSYLRKNDCCVLLVTHDFLFAERISDKIAILNNGEISPFFTVDEFTKNEKIKFVENN